MEIPAGGLKLNIACGGMRVDGWIGIDVMKRDSTDIVAEMNNIPLPNKCASQIMVIHAVEHIYSWEVPAALDEWFRLLRRGGKLILEMPDVMKACQNIAEGWKGTRHPDQQGLWALYGDDRHKDPLMVHRAGWWFERLKPVVHEAGFINITEMPTQYHPVGRKRRDFRLEADRP